jgi:hypothetical protein
MAGGGGRCVLGRAREKEGEVLYARRGGSTSPSWPTGTPAWARSGGDLRRSTRPMRNGGSPTGECTPATWHRPRPPRKRHDL